MIGAIPKDLAQYFSHVLRVSRKLLYVYGWPSFLEDDQEHLDDVVEEMLILFVRALFGVGAAHRGVTQVAAMIAEQAIRPLSPRVFTTGSVAEVVEAALAQLGWLCSRWLSRAGWAKRFLKVGPSYAVD